MDGREERKQQETKLDASQNVLAQSSGGRHAV